MTALGGPIVPNNDDVSKSRILGFRWADGVQKVLYRNHTIGIRAFKLSFYLVSSIGWIDAWYLWKYMEL